MSPAVIAPSKAPRLLLRWRPDPYRAPAAPPSAAAQGSTRPEPAAPGTQPTRRPGAAARRRAPPAYIAAVDGVARLEREGQSEAAERGVPLVPGDRAPHRGRPRRARLPQRHARSISIATPRSSCVDVLVLRLARGRLYVRVTVDRSTPPSALAVDAPGASVRLPRRRRVPHRASAAPTPSRSSSRCSAARPRSSARAATSSCRRASRAWSATARRRRRRNGSTPARPRSSAGPPTAKRCGRAASTPRASTCPAELVDYAATFDRYGTWQNDETYGAVWYPAVDDRGLAAVLRRPLGLQRELRLDLGRRRRRVGLPHPPLRPLEPRHARLVLDSVAPLGPGVGLLGRRAGLRRLVPARLERPAGAERVPLRPAAMRRAGAIPTAPGRSSRATRSAARTCPASTPTAAASFAISRRSCCSTRARLRAAALALSVARSIPRPATPAPAAAIAPRSGGGVSTMQPAQLRALRQRSRQPRRARRAARHRLRGEHDVRLAVRARASAHAPSRAQATSDDGAVYRRVPADQSPVRSPGGLWRDRRDRDGDGDRDDDGRGGAGLRQPRLPRPRLARHVASGRARPQPGMSDRPTRARAAPCRAPIRPPAATTTAAAAHAAADPATAPPSRSRRLGLASIRQRRRSQQRRRLRRQRRWRRRRLAQQRRRRGRSAGIP